MLDAMDEIPEQVTAEHRVAGCLVGGAVGDALGAEVEFMTLAEIRRSWGAAGVRDYTAADGRGRITDDTQMTLFTAEGLIRAMNRSVDRGICNVTAVLHRAYQRWLLTQHGDRSRVPWDWESPGEPSGWLVEQHSLWVRRAPGNTCLGALEGGRMGEPEHPINDSKGCGGVMRVAPVGLTASDPFDLGCRAAAITHTHPTGYLAAGAFAEIVGGLVGGADLADAVAGARRRLEGEPDSTETLTALTAAVELGDC